MLIRKSQIEVFKEALLAITEKQLVDHCREYAPRLFQAAGEGGIRQAVRLGIQRARGYSLCDEPQVRLYVDMMLVLGSEFDTDPQFPWAAETLQDQFSRPHVRGLVLHRDLLLYLDRVMGPQSEYVKAALRRFVGLPPELPPPEQRSISGLRGWLRELFPGKSDDVSDSQLAQIAACAGREASELGIPVGDGLLAGVMLSFGYGATHDPLYPWISNVLHDPRITSPEARLARLWAKMRAYAAGAGKYLTEAI